MSNWLNLENKVAVVTGALGGMGSKICEEFASQGAKVVLVDLLVDKAEAYAKELSEKFGVETLAVECNTTSQESVDAAVEKVKAKFGRADILVNTAAILRFAPFEDLDMDDYEATINVNIKGYYLMTQRFGRLMIEQKYGNIVHISSIASHFPETYSGAYSMTKAAVNMLSKQVAAEWGEHGVRSNCVLPCFVQTPLSASFYADPEVEEGRKRLTASKRIGNVQDVANAVLYLSSDRSNYTNGSELRVEGGFGIMMGDMTPKPGGRRGYAEEYLKNRKK